MNVQKMFHFFILVITPAFFIANAEICELDSAINLLKQDHPHKPRYGYAAMVTFREKIIDSTISILKNETGNTYAMVYALRLAGDYRMEEASNLLIKNITVGNPLTISILNTRDAFPAVDAICKIGIPACSKILKQINGKEKERRLALYAYCIRECYGDSGIHLIDQRLAEVNNESVEKSLKYLRERFILRKPQ